MSRGAKLTIIFGVPAILLGFVAIPVSIYVPEVRRWVGLQGPPCKSDSLESPGGPSINLPDGTRIKGEKGGSVKYTGKGQKVERTATTMTSIFGEHRTSGSKTEITDPNVEIKPSPGDH